MFEQSGRSLREVAADLGIHESTLRTWWNRERRMRQKKNVTPTKGALVDKGEGPEAEIARLRKLVVELEKRTARLEMEKSILKKAAAFFAKESE